MIMPVNDMWRPTPRAIVTEIVGPSIFCRWMNDRQLAAYTGHGTPNTQLIDMWGHSLLNTLATWRPGLLHRSLHDLPLDVDMLPHLQAWLDHDLLAASEHLDGRMAFVAPAELIEPLRVIVMHPRLQTAVFPSYRAALLWLQESM